MQGLSLEAGEQEGEGSVGAEEGASAQSFLPGSTSLMSVTVMEFLVFTMVT